MDVRCEVCGCRTEENQLSEFLLAGRKTKVCPVCKKSLNAIAKNPQQHASEAHNILGMNTGGRRSPEVQNALTGFFGAIGLTDGNARPDSSGNAQSQELEALRRDLEALKLRFDRFYRRYVISKILAIALPILLVVIMLIILLASGAIGNIIDYYNTIVEYANM